MDLERFWKNRNQRIAIKPELHHEVIACKLARVSSRSFRCSMNNVHPFDQVEQLNFLRTTGSEVKAVPIKHLKFAFPQETFLPNSIAPRQIILIPSWIRSHYENSRSEFPHWEWSRLQNQIESDLFPGNQFAYSIVWTSGSEFLVYDFKVWTGLSK